MHQMKSKIALNVVLCMATVAILLGCRQKASEEIDFGTVQDSVYRNDYLGLTVSLPPAWSIQDEESRRELMKKGGEMAAGDDKALQSAVKASEMTTVSLFAAFESPLGAPVAFNPNIIGMAERVRHLPGIKSGEDYLFHSKNMLQQSQVNVSFLPPVPSELLGGQSFDVMATEMSISGITVRQKYYVSIVKGYALVFIVSFQTDDQESALQDILSTVSIDV